MKFKTVAAFLAGYAVGVATSNVSAERVREPMDVELLSDEGEVDPVDQEAPDISEDEYEKFLEWFLRNGAPSEGDSEQC